VPGAKNPKHPYCPQDDDTECPPFGIPVRGGCLNADQSGDSAAHYGEENMMYHMGLDKNQETKCLKNQGPQNHCQQFNVSSTPRIAAQKGP